MQWPVVSGRLHVDNISQEDEQRHRNGAEGRRVHDDLCGVFRLVFEFDGVHGRVDSRRHCAVDKEDDRGHWRERARCKMVPQEDGGKADEREADELDEAGQPHFAVQPFDLRP